MPVYESLDHLFDARLLIFRQKHILFARIGVGIEAHLLTYARTASRVPILTPEQETVFEATFLKFSMP